MLAFKGKNIVNRMLKARKKKKNLKKVPNVDYQAPWNGVNINPLILMKNLQSPRLIFHKNSEESIIYMFGDSHGQFWLRANWIVMAYQGTPFVAFHGS